jgi:hypothetical protein
MMMTQPLWLLFALSVVASASCAGASQMQIAQSAADVTHDVLQMVDEHFTPGWTKALQDADAAHPNDEAGFRQQLAPMQKTFDAIERARVDYALLVIALTTWRDTDDLSLWYQALPCALGSLGTLANQLTGALRDATTAALGAVRASIADPGECTRTQ